MDYSDRVTESRTDARFQDDDSSANSAILDILPENIPNTIITKAPEERFRLGYWSVIALVVNRVIGEETSKIPINIETILSDYCRNRYLQFPIDCHARDQEYWYQPTLLACWSGIHHRRNTFEYRIWPLDAKTQV